LHCHDVVQTKHVKEAYRLLNKSIIRVETPDIQFDNDEETGFNEINEDVEMADTENQDPNASADDGEAGDGADDSAPAKTPAKKDSASKDAPKAPAQKVKITYEKYRNIANMLVLFMRQEEDKAMTEEGAAAESGLRRSDVVNWYLTEIESEIETETALETETFLVKCVIDRLVKNDGVLLALKAPILTEESLEAAADDEADPYLVVHPNYIIET